MRKMFTEMKADLADGEGGGGNGKFDVDVTKLVDLQTHNKLSDKVDKLWDMLHKFKDETHSNLNNIHDEL